MIETRTAEYRVRANEWLDSLPRAQIRLGARSISPFFALGAAGTVVGHLVMLALAAGTGRSVAVTFALGPIAVATFVLVALIRRALTGQETLVLHEQLASVLLVAAAALALADQAVLAHLDLLVVGLSVFLAFGRVGCTIVGCCYGVTAGLGIVYPPECHGHCAGSRRFPVQLLEAMCWGALTFLGVGLCLSVSAGVCSAVTLTVYGEARVALEMLRGDARPHFLRLSVAQWFGLLTTGVGLALASRVQGLAPQQALLLVSGVGSAIVLFASARVWLSIAAAGDEAEAVDQARSWLSGCDLDQEIRTASFGSVTVAGRRTEVGMEVSVCDRTAPMPRARGLRWLEALVGARIEGAQLVRGQRGLWMVRVER